MPSQDVNKLEQIKKMRKLAIAVAALIVTILVALTIISITAPKPIERFTPNQYSEGYIQDAENILEAEKEDIQENNNIGNLMDKLPYQGKYFSMKFNNDTVKFDAVISQRNKAEGDVEFDEFLKTNGIKGRDSFFNLNVQYR